MNKGFLALLVLLQVFSTKIFAQAPVVFTGDNVVIGKHVSILEDVNNNFTINDVTTSKKFVPSLTETPNLQLTQSGFWLKFTVKNRSISNNLILSLEYPTLTVCEFYYSQNGKFYNEKLSDVNSFYKRKYDHQNFIFDIKLPKDSAGTYYLHVKSTEQMVLPLILATPQKMAESMLATNILWGIFIGLIVVMVLYNFFIYLFTRDISYLYYVFYSSFIGLTQTTLSGYTYHYLFADSPTLFHKCIIIFPALAGISAMLFVRTFLHTKTSTPRMHKLFTVAIAAYSTAIVLRIFGFDQASYRMIDFSALFTTAIIYIVAVIISLQGYRPAKLFLLAWTIFFAGIILFTLRNLGVLPYNNYTNYTMESGIAFEVTLLSLALADKINILKKEKEASQAESLERAEENARIIREQNVVLEQKVTERTVELSESNNELNKTLVDLKEAQGQLVESEKMASLGQLTAGIAHEINNPINFVTSNINPLKRDIDMMMDALTMIESVGISDATPAEKQKKIQEYKDELDFDYLTHEIKHLLKGINEGANRTAEIVKGLKIFSRLDEDDLKKADLNEGIESTMVIANNLLNGKIAVVKEYGDLPRVECYAGKLNQVFLNIISNAIYAIQKRFGDNTGGQLTITTLSDEDNVFIKIKDNGTGMDEATQKKIFEPFFTTKDVGEGTGLGMSIAYNTIKKHDGQITVNSVVDEGTEFILELPIIFSTKPV